MKIFAVVCTRTKEFSKVTQNLFNTLSSFGVEIKVMTNQTSIFEAYKKGLYKCNAAGNDIVIFCHDDIELLDTKADFIGKLAHCLNFTTGIVGPAGTSFLGPDAVWWNHDHWKAGFHSGAVYHRSDSGQVYNTEYGPFKKVVVLDGLFLAARKAVWDAVGMEKPEYFEGNWDFYDLHYTSKAHNLKLENHTIPIKIIHHSAGEIVGRDSWHKNREAFIRNTELPLMY